ncbi:MAG: hypothetical protein R2851_02110 [Caldilineaceae bacterium]
MPTHRTSAIGDATAQIVALLLDDKAVDRLRTVRRLLRLGEQYGDDRLEVACQRALQFGEPSYMTVKRILTGELDLELTPPAVPTPPAVTFARKASNCSAISLAVMYGTDSPTHPYLTKLRLRHPANPGDLAT